MNDIAREGLIGHPQFLPMLELISDAYMVCANVEDGANGVALFMTFSYMQTDITTYEEIDGFYDLIYERTKRLWGLRSRIVGNELEGKFEDLAELVFNTVGPTFC